MAWWGPSDNLESGPKHEQGGFDPARVGDWPLTAEARPSEEQRTDVEMSGWPESEGTV